MKTFSRPVADGRLVVQAHAGILQSVFVGPGDPGVDLVSSCLVPLVDWLSEGRAGGLPSPWVRGWK